MAVGYVASASSGSRASVASFNIGTLGTGARAGIVFVAVHNSSTDIITGVTWNSVAMTRLYRAVDTDTEPGSVVAYFLDNVSNGTITVSRTNNATVTVGYAASISASSACIVAQTITRVSSTQTTNGDTSTTGTGASGEVSVTDNSPGTSSMRFAAAYTGAATPLGAGTNSTSLQSLDSTALGSSFVRETTAGQGSRSVGFATGTTDDYAAVFVAVAEKIDTNPQPTAASLTTTTGTPAVVLNTISLPTAGAIALTGATPTVVATANVTASPTAASATLTGATPTVTAPAVSLPTAAALILTGATPVVDAEDNVFVLPTVGSMTITGATPTVLTPIVSLPTAGSQTLTGATPAVVASDHKTSLPTAGALSLTGATPDVVAGQGTAILPTAGALTLTGATPTVTAPAISLPTVGSMTITGATPTVLTPVVSLPTAGAMTATGATPAVLTPIVSLPTAAAQALTGATPTVAATNNVLLFPTPATLALTGAVPAVTGVTAPVAPPYTGGGPRRRPIPPIDIPADDDDVLALIFAA